MELYLIGKSGLRTSLTASRVFRQAAGGQLSDDLATIAVVIALFIILLRGGNLCEKCRYFWLGSSDRIHRKQIVCGQRLLKALQSRPDRRPHSITSSKGQNPLASRAATTEVLNLISLLSAISG